ncbi:MAG: HAD family hydrolase [Gemmataceae bacterium]|nr:HAD family hydrolase [Gemmataceae bacterium]MDW8243251.1 HAD family hydrolase [Thermogemmata sp.]
MTVLLFDIDGTLVRTGGAGKAAMEEALRSAFGVRQIQDGVPYAGRTDRAIARDLLRVHHIPPVEENITRLQRAYLDHLPRMLHQRGGTVCPGVVELLRTLSTVEGMVLGLLTGNIREGARCKLAHFGLWDYFVGGGFGDEHEDRDDVARAAVAALGLSPALAADATRQVWVIGDTPLDIRCARAIGAHAVAVATGWHSPQELAAHRPDWLLPDLTCVETVLPYWCPQKPGLERPQNKRRAHG